MSDGGGTLFKSYGGEEFLAQKFKKRPWLIEHVLREKDTVLFVGDKKAGKSLLIQQVMCSLTSGQAFLDRFKILRPCKISYVQLEGEIEDTQDRVSRLMANVEFNPKHFQILYYPTIQLEQREAAEQLYKAILDHHHPDVLIIDPLYCAMGGSLSDDEAVRGFLGNVRWIKGMLNCAIIIIHHTHKLRMDRTGAVMNEGDDAAFGSVFLAAYADFVMLFVYNNIEL
jgi:RecA-family ATPase